MPLSTVRLGRFSPLLIGSELISVVEPGHTQPADSERRLEEEDEGR